MMKTTFEVDLNDLDSIAYLLSSGITTPEMLVDAFPDELELIEDCVVIQGSPIYADDGYNEIEFPPDTSPSKAAKIYVEGGDYGEPSTSTFWITVRTYRKGIDENGNVEWVEREDHTVAVDPDEPECVDGHDHQWASPYSILGGCKENPGVWGHGGGVYIKSVCMLCGCEKTIDTWAQNPENGEQGLDSVEYEEGKYSEEIEARLIAKAKEALETDVDLEGYEEDAANYDFVWENEDGALVGCDNSDLHEYGIRLRVEGDTADRPMGTAIEENE